MRTLHFGEKKNKAILSATATRGLATMELAIPPDLLVVPGGESWEKTAEDGRVPIEKKLDQSCVSVSQDKKSLRK